MTSQPPTPAPSLAPLPFGITSFGGVRVGSRIYLYGGHIGTSHQYSTDEQSGALLQLDLDRRDAGWQQISSGPKLQGLALVSDGRRVIRLGGFTARNPLGAEHDLHSSTEVAAYDPDSDQWTGLPEMPEPRSSFDAAVIDQTVFVVGGWNMSGDLDPVWHETAWSLDLSRHEAAWQPMASPPAPRRALAVAAHQGRLFAIGGMGPDGASSGDVHIYDPSANRWSSGPSLGGTAMTGFGAAAWSVAGNLISSTMEGAVRRLSDDQRNWQTVGQTRGSRFFHRLIPFDNNTLLLIGGANMEQGKYLEIESIQMP